MILVNHPVGDASIVLFHIKWILNNVVIVFYNIKKTYFVSFIYFILQLIHLHPIKPLRNLAKINLIPDS